jgi:O-acetyl-ADP-ribose deacetylase (regulator of RNase III)
MLWRASEYSIRHSVHSAMQLVQQHNFSSIAFPIIGAGSGSFDQTRALTVIQDAFQSINATARVVVVRYKTH